MNRIDFTGDFFTFLQKKKKKKTLSKKKKNKINKQITPIDYILYEVYMQNNKIYQLKNISNAEYWNVKKFDKTPVLL